MAGLNRNNLEKYYTNPDVCKRCIQAFESVVKPTHTDTILEPSAGNGSFSLLLANSFPNLVAFDIQPEHPTITKQDFLTYDLSLLREPIHVIGNPPFGRQSGIAKKFIQKACKYASSIAFILPKSFKKASFQRVFPTSFHLVFSEDLSENSFLLDGQPHHVPCVFQIWLRLEDERSVDEIQSPLYYSFVKKSEAHDFSIRRVGGTAGKLDTHTEDKSIQSHYFLKLHVDLPDFSETYNQLVKFSHDNTVGPKSISKQELITELNRLYF